MKSFVCEHIGNQIRKRRKEKGVSQANLAVAIGLSRLSVVNIEANRQSATPDTIYLVCCALNITPNELFPAMETLK